jgi:hypothetical protein
VDYISTRPAIGRVRSGLARVDALVGELRARFSTYYDAVRKVVKEIEERCEDTPARLSSRSGTPAQRIRALVGGVAQHVRNEGSRRGEASEVSRS